MKTKLLKVFVVLFCILSFLKVGVFAENFIGIRNIGASCFANTAIQQLYHTDKFRKEILSIKDLDKKTQPTISLIKSIFLKIERTGILPSKVIDISHELSELKIYKGLPDDAQITMMNLVDRCDKEYKGEKEHFTKIFGLNSVQLVFCRHCHEMISRQEVDTGGMLMLMPEHNLATMITRYAQPAKLEEKKCDLCQEVGACYLSKKFKATSDAVLVHIIHGSKIINDRVEFNEFYNFNSPNAYRLKSIAMYTGGHYYIIVNDKRENCWYKISDSSVIRFNSFEKIKEICYGKKCCMGSAITLCYERFVKF